MSAIKPQALLIAKQQLKSAALAGLISEVEYKEIEERLIIDPDADLSAMLSYGDIADLCGVCVSTVRNWRRQGRLSPIKLGHSLVRFRKEEVLALQKNKHLFS